MRRFEAHAALQQGLQTCSHDVFGSSRSELGFFRANRRKKNACV